MRHLPKVKRFSLHTVCRHKPLCYCLNCFGFQHSNNVYQYLFSFLLLTQAVILCHIYVTFPFLHYLDFALGYNDVKEKQTNKKPQQNPKNKQKTQNLSKSISSLQGVKGKQSISYGGDQKQSTNILHAYFASQHLWHFENFLKRSSLKTSGFFSPSHTLSSAFCHWPYPFLTHLSQVSQTRFWCIQLLL